MKDNRIIDTDFPRAWQEYRLSRLVYEPKKMSRQEAYEGFTARDPITTFIAYRINASYRKAFLESDHFRQYRTKCI